VQACNIALVTRSIFTFNSHEGEVNAIKFHKSGKYFATGGGDRKIKLWEYKDNKCELISNLIGSNASIASIDIDSEVNDDASSWPFYSVFLVSDLF
jgi:WD40 repeat protein